MAERTCNGSDRTTWGAYGEFRTALFRPVIASRFPLGFSARSARAYVSICPRLSTVRRQFRLSVSADKGQSKPGYVPRGGYERAYEGKRPFSSCFPVLVNLPKRDVGGASENLPCARNVASAQAQGSTQAQGSRHLFYAGVCWVGMTSKTWRTWRSTALAVHENAFRNSLVFNQLRHGDLTSELVCA
jgi:hypothetical protein